MLARPMKKYKIPSLISTLAFLSLITINFTSCLKQRQPNIYEFPTRALEESLLSTINEGPFTPGEWPQAHWWLMFGDNQLNMLISKALSDNPGIKIAQARVKIANYAARAAGSALWPTLELETDIARSRTSKTGTIASIASSSPPASTFTTPPASPTRSGGFIFTQTEINLDAHYQLDIWQQNLNSFKAAVGEILASKADAAFSSVILSTSIAQTYFRLQVSYAQKILALKKLHNRAEYLQLVEKRVKNDIDNQCVLKKAQTYHLEAQLLLKQVQLKIKAYKNQLQALIAGDFCEPIEAIAVENQDLFLFSLPTNLPFNLLAHRPDVTASVWRVEEAAKKIKVARAAYYPSFNIMGLFGYQTLHPHDLFKWRSIYGQASPAINLPIFEGGLLQANLGTAHEEYYIAIEQYNQSILTAVQAVLDSIAELKYAFEEMQDSVQITKLSEENSLLIKEKFKHYLASYLDVLDAEFDKTSQENKKLVALENYYIRFTSLISALGGGYDNESQ